MGKLEGVSFCRTLKSLILSTLFETFELVAEMSSISIISKPLHFPPSGVVTVIVNVRPSESTFSVATMLKGVFGSTVIVIRENFHWFGKLKRNRRDSVCSDNKFCSRCCTSNKLSETCIVYELPKILLLHD